jgi:hypothetical protein
MLHGTTVKFKTPRLSYNTRTFKTFILRTAVAIIIKKGNMYTYDSALQILMPTFTILLWGDVSSVGICDDLKTTETATLWRPQISKLLYF